MSDTNEYLRRNLIVAKATGIQSAATVALDRLCNLKRQPGWLVDLLRQIETRAPAVVHEVAEHRDEVKP
jgi:hypothetical protein